MYSLGCLLQFVALTLWEGFGNWQYFVLLLAMAAAGHVLVHKPLHDPAAPRSVQLRGAVMCVVFPACIVGLQLLSPYLRADRALSIAPGYVFHSPDMQDVRLNLTAPQFIPGVWPPQAGTLINPSILWVDGELRLAVRQHYFSLTNESGVFPTVDSSGANVTAYTRVTQTWHSYILTGLLDPASLEQTGESVVVLLLRGCPHPPTRSRAANAFRRHAGLPPWRYNALIHAFTPGMQTHTLPLRGFACAGEWLPCLIPPVYVAANRSISQVVSVGGLEDPRLLFYNGSFANLSCSADSSSNRVCERRANTSVGLTFYSNPPRDLEAEEAGVAPGPQYGWIYAQVWGEPPLQGLCPRKGRVFLADAAGSPGSLGSVAQQLRRQGEKGYDAEKNWMYFPSDGGKFVSDMQPHTVLDAPAAFENPVGLAIELSRNSPDLQVSLAAGAVIHGGANPIRLDEDTYLGSFHSILSGQYSNYLYEFNAHTPYQVLRVSAPLPLITAPLADGSITVPMAFSSGLTRTPDGRVLVAYGSSNAEARVLVLNEVSLAQLFAGSRRASAMVDDCSGNWSEWSKCEVHANGLCGRKRVYSVAHISRCDKRRAHSSLRLVRSRVA
jgi:hypothetical protein